MADKMHQDNKKEIGYIEREIPSSVVSGFILFVFFLIIMIPNFVFPVIAEYKSTDKNNIKTTCAYILGTRKFKNHFEYRVKIDDTVYLSGDLHTRGSFFLKENFPMERKEREFYQETNWNQCLKVSYISVVDIYFWKKIYLYDFLASGSLKTNEQPE